MSEVLPIQSPPSPRPTAASIGPSQGARARGARTEAAPGASSKDRVELSDVAVYLSRLKADQDIRSDLVDQARQQIQAGTFLTDQRVDGTVDQILRDHDEIDLLA